MKMKQGTIEGNDNNARIIHLIENAKKPIEDYQIRRIKLMI